MDSPDEVDPKLQSKYRAIIGYPAYLYQWTRQNRGFCTYFLSRYRLVKTSEKRHLKAQATKLVLLYLQGSFSCGIRYTRYLSKLKARDREMNVLYNISDNNLHSVRTPLSPHQTL
jgi:hypothetical protein